MIGSAAGPTCQLRAIASICASCVKVGFRNGLGARSGGHHNRAGQKASDQQPAYALPHRRCAIGFHARHASFVRDSYRDRRRTNDVRRDGIALNGADSASRGDTGRTPREIHMREAPRSIPGVPVLGIGLVEPFSRCQATDPFVSVRVLRRTRTRSLRDRVPVHDLR